MAGPVYRFEQTCKAIAKGDFSQRVHLRKGDQLTDLQDEFNNMMDRVEEEIKKSKKRGRMKKLFWLCLALCLALPVAAQREYGLRFSSLITTN